MENGRGEEMEKGRIGKGRGGKVERRESGEEGRGRGADGGSTYSSYCYSVSLSLQLCEEELKN